MCLHKSGRIVQRDLSRLILLPRAKIDEKLERRFRELAMKKFGYGKEALIRTVVEAS